VIFSIRATTYFTPDGVSKIMDNLSYKYLIPNGILLKKDASFHLLHQEIYRSRDSNIIHHYLSIDPVRDPIFVGIISTKMNLNPVRDVI